VAQDQDNQRVAVIGGGLGGVSAAISLATEGFDVTLYDKSSHLGGKLNLAEIEGFSFDLGPSILILPHIFERLWERAGRSMYDDLTLVELAPHWRSFFTDRTWVDLHPDMRHMERELARFSPADSDGWWAYMDYSRRMWKFAEEAYLDRHADSLWEIARGYGLGDVHRRADFFTSSMAAGVARYVKHWKLQYILNFFIKYVGSSSYDAPAIYNLLAYSQMGYGEWYVQGGMYNLARALRRLAEAVGVKLMLGTEVKAITRRGERVTGITLTDGSSVEADWVVCNMEVIPAYERLLDEPPDSRFIKKYAEKYEPSCSGLVVHLGVDREYPQLAHHNFFFAHDQREHFEKVYQRYELPMDPTIYVVAPTRTDKTLAPPGCEIIKLLPHIPHIQDPPHTSDDYMALKEALYRKLETMGLHELRQHIVVEDVLVPDDIERMYLSNKGSIYGVVANRRKNQGLRAPKRSEKYERLFFVGGSVNPGGGMPMVISSGQMVRDMIIEELSSVGTT
jgi:diapolycopene oxygenase